MRGSALEHGEGETQAHGARFVYFHSPAYQQEDTAQVLALGKDLPLIETHDSGARGDVVHLALRHPFQ